MGNAEFTTATAAPGEPSSDRAPARLTTRSLTGLSAACRYGADVGAESGGGNGFTQRQRVTETHGAPRWYRASRGMDRAAATPASRRCVSDGLRGGTSLYPSAAQRAALPAWRLPVPNMTLWTAGLPFVLRISVSPCRSVASVSSDMTCAAACQSTSSARSDRHPHSAACISHSELHCSQS